MLAKHLLSMSMPVVAMLAAIMLLDPPSLFRALPRALPDAGSAGGGESARGGGNQSDRRGHNEGGREAALLPRRFETLPPGSSLPSGEECAARVRPAPDDPRPLNARANHTRGGTIRRIDGLSRARNVVYASRIDGNYTGTTDEILQWGACKWGFDEDIVRAVAVQESYWRQSTLGDFLDGEYQTFGLLQVKRTVHLETWPLSARSTAFNVDYALAWHRACFEGDFGWLNQVQPGAGYAAGDQWGCLGAWYSGRWYNQRALRYMAEVRLALRQRVWLRPDF